MVTRTCYVDVLQPEGDVQSHLSNPLLTATCVLLLQIMYKGVLEGQASAGKFLELLANSDQEAVQVGAGPEPDCGLRGWGWAGWDGGTGQQWCSGSRCTCQLQLAPALFIPRCVHYIAAAPARMHPAGGVLPRQGGAHADQNSELQH